MVEVREVGVDASNKTQSTSGPFFPFLLFPDSRSSKNLNAPIKIHCLFPGQVYEVKIYLDDAY
jgi:hypothetical protein